MKRIPIEITVLNKESAPSSFRRLNAGISKLEEARLRKKSVDSRSTSLVNQLTTVNSTQEIWCNFKKSSFNNVTTKTAGLISKESHIQPVIVNEQPTINLFNYNLELSGEVRPNTPLRNALQRNFLPIASTRSTDGLLIKESGSERKKSLMQKAWMLHQVLTGEESESKEVATDHRILNTKTPINTDIIEDDIYKSDCISDLNEGGLEDLLKSKVHNDPCVNNLMSNEETVKLKAAKKNKKSLSMENVQDLRYPLYLPATSLGKESSESSKINDLITAHKEQMKLLTKKSAILLKNKETLITSKLKEHTESDPFSSRNIKNKSSDERYANITDNTERKPENKVKSIEVALVSKKATTNTLKVDDEMNKRQKALSKEIDSKASYQLEAKAKSLNKNSHNTEYLNVNDTPKLKKPRYISYVKNKQTQAKVTTPMQHKDSKGKLNAITRLEGEKSKPKLNAKTTTEVTKIVNDSKGDTMNEQVQVDEVKEGSKQQQRNKGILLKQNYKIQSKSEQRNIKFNMSQTREDIDNKGGKDEHFKLSEDYIIPIVQATDWFKDASIISTKSATKLKESSERGMSGAQVKTQDMKSNVSSKFKVETNERDKRKNDDIKLQMTLDELKKELKHQQEIMQEEMERKSNNWLLVNNTENKIKHNTINSKYFKVFINKEALDTNAETELNKKDQITQTASKISNEKDNVITQSNAQVNTKNECTRTNEEENKTQNKVKDTEVKTENTRTIPLNAKVDIRELEVNTRTKEVQIRPKEEEVKRIEIEIRNQKARLKSAEDEIKNNEITIKNIEFNLKNCKEEINNIKDELYNLKPKDNLMKGKKKVTDTKSIKKAKSIGNQKTEAKETINYLDLIKEAANEIH